MLTRRPALLVENPQRLITQAELLKAIWQREYVSDGLLRGSIRELCQRRPERELQ
jgi:DNA-binding winged helix-turn-helix (wHTH) protein